LRGAVKYGNYERLAQHLWTVQPQKAIAPTRLSAQSVLGRRAHADGAPPGGVTPSARNTQARCLSQETGANVGSRHNCRRDSRCSDKEEE